MSEITFYHFALADPIQRALKAKGYTKPSPIQTQAIPVLLKWNDLLACTQTGTGKTEAFALPIYDHNYHASQIEHHHTSGAPREKGKTR